MNVYTCSTCGAQCAPASYPSHDLRIMARDAEDRIYCQVCAADMDRRTLAETGRVAAYLASDGKHITTWAGEVLANVVGVGETRRLTCWQARTPDGRMFYGRCGGRGMYTTVRGYKR